MCRGLRMHTTGVLVFVSVSVFHTSNAQSRSGLVHHDISAKGPARFLHPYTEQVGGVHDTCVATEKTTYGTTCVARLGGCMHRGITLVVHFAGELAGHYTLCEYGCQGTSGPRGTV